MTDQIVESGGGHTTSHRTESRPAYGVWCYNCGEYVEVYEP